MAPRRVTPRADASGLYVTLLTARVIGRFVGRAKPAKCLGIPKFGGLHSVRKAEQRNRKASAGSSRCWPRAGSNQRQPRKRHASEDACVTRPVAASIVANCRSRNRRGPQTVAAGRRPTPSPSRHGDSGGQPAHLSGLHAQRSDNASMSRERHRRHWPPTASHTCTVPSHTTRRPVTRTVRAPRAGADSASMSRECQEAPAADGIPHLHRPVRRPGGQPRPVRAPRARSMTFRFHVRRG